MPRRSGLGMGTLVYSLLKGLNSQSLGQVCPEDAVVLSLEHKLDVLPVVVYIDSSIEDPDHLWIIVVAILKQRDQPREKVKQGPEILNTGCLRELIYREIQ